MAQRTKRTASKQKSRKTSGEQTGVLPLRLGENGVVVSPSSDRVIAPCGVLDRCGGCSFQEMAYAAQLRAKRDALTLAFRQLGADDLVGDVIGIEPPFGFRTRLLMPAVMDRGRLVLGFYQRGTTSLVEAAGCPIQHPATLAILAMVTQILRGVGVVATDPPSPKGWLHGLSIRVDPLTGRGELVLATRTPQLPKGANLAERLGAVPGVEGVHLTASENRSSYLFGERFRHLGGRARTVLQLDSEAFHLSPGSFFQSNPKGAKHLVDIVQSFIPARFASLADLYGGVGVFTRLTNGHWDRAVVVESNPYAVSDLRGWLKATGRTKVYVIEGRTEDHMDEVLKAHPDVVILDPPRAGCQGRALRALTPSRVATLVYVSCGVEAFLRDARVLLEQGYRIDRVAAVDMFPHTAHIEVVARFGSKVGEV